MLVNTCNYMDNFETLYDTYASKNTKVYKSQRKKSVLFRVPEVSAAGRIGSRTNKNKHYTSSLVEKDVYALKDKKYRTLNLPVSYYMSVGCGRNGTYNEEFEYKPGVPATSNIVSQVQSQVYGHRENTMMLLDAEHALNASNVNKLSHGGIKSIPVDTHVDPAVSDVVAMEGPDSISLNRMRGLRYQFNYTNPAGLSLLAQENFMAAMAGKITNPYSTARPATTIVGN